MKLIYFFLFYTWIMVLISSCASFCETLNEMDWSYMGTTMQQTGRNAQRENHEQKMKPQVQVVQQKPIGAVCTMELVRDPFYGHYEALEVCR